jgi:hypothetical protein
MSTFLAILTGVVTGLVLSAIIYFLKSRFGSQPRLRIRCLPGPSSSTSGMSGYIKLTWKGYLEIYNETSFPALNVSFGWANSSTSLPLHTLEPPHVNGMESRKVGFEIVKQFPREQVLASVSRFKDLCPSQLRSFTLILRYKNDRGVRFYSRFEKSGDDQRCTYHRLKPRG